MFEEFLQTARVVFQTAQREGLLIRNPDEARLKALSLVEPEVQLTKYGSIAAQSEPMSRAAKFTKNNIDVRFGQAEYELLEQAKRTLATQEIVSIDVEVGDGSEGITARLIVPRRYAHVAYGGRKLFKPTTTENPTYQVVMFFDEAFEENKREPLPQKKLTIRLAHSPDGQNGEGRPQQQLLRRVEEGRVRRRRLPGEAQGRRHLPACRLPQNTLETANGQYVTTLLAVRGPQRNGKTTHHLPGARPERPRTLLADPGRRRHALPRRPVPRLRGGRTVRQDRLPQAPPSRSRPITAVSSPPRFLENCASRPTAASTSSTWS